MAMSSPTLAKALAAATEAHAGQSNKTGRPYIEHPKRVAGHFSDETLQAIALLHDVVEKSSVTVEDPKRDFGEVIAMEVDVLSRRPGEDYMSFVRRAAARPLSRKVKIADLHDNIVATLQAPDVPDRARRLARYQEALKYLLSLEQ